MSLSRAASRDETWRRRRRDCAPVGPRQTIRDKGRRMGASRASWLVPSLGHCRSRVALKSIADRGAIFQCHPRERDAPVTPFGPGNDIINAAAAHIETSPGPCSPSSVCSFLSIVIPLARFLCPVVQPIQGGYLLSRTDANYFIRLFFFFSSKDQHRERKKKKKMARKLQCNKK